MKRTREHAWSKHLSYTYFELFSRSARFFPLFQRARLKKLTSPTTNGWLQGKLESQFAGQKLTLYVSLSPAGLHHTVSGHGSVHGHCSAGRGRDAARDGPQYCLSCSPAEGKSTPLSCMLLTTVLHFIAVSKMFAGSKDFVGLVLFGTNGQEFYLL